jgi:ABC-type multidrug transport system fused ATPase/permease subunit
MTETTRLTDVETSPPGPLGVGLAGAEGRGHAFGTLLGGSWIRAGLLVASATAMGLSEAGVLAVVARAATTLATGSRTVDARLGPIGVHASLAHLLLVGGALAVFRLIMLVPTSVLGAGITGDVQQKMLRGLFDAFARASWSSKASDREGHLQELMTNQVSQAIQGSVYSTLLLTNLFAFLALIAAAVVISPKAAGIVVVLSAALFAVLRPLSRAGSRGARDLSAAQLEQAGGVSEATRLAEETQVFGVADEQRAQIGRLIDQTRRLLFRTQLALRLVPSTYQSAVYLLLVGGLAVIYAADEHGLASLGAVLLLLVRGGTYGNLAQNAYQVVRQALPFVDRIQAAEQRYADSTPSEGSLPFKALERLSFRDVSFAYPGGKWVLSHVTFDIERGEVIGIIGPSGSGKSTLAQLLLRLRDPSEGGYLVNGALAADLRRSDWTSRVAYVPQTPQLIYASVADNIRYFREIDDAAVERAARLARIHDDVVGWSDGYDTIVGPRAAAVSVGQAQRICLARALLLQPEVLLLDEPTSALDPTSERLVQESLSVLKGDGDLTLFLIAHRMSTLDICDRVMVIVDGRLDAFEPFDSLRVRSACYRVATSTQG